MIATLPAELESFVESQVKSGRFSSANDVIAASVRLLQELSAGQGGKASAEEIEALSLELSQPDDDIRSGRVRQINSESESHAYAEEIIGRGRVRLEAERRGL